MGVKSDKWIRRMAEEQGMISPFEPGQVKAVRPVSRVVPGWAEAEDQITVDYVPCGADAPGAERIVSYGTSSYGYDLRVAPDWRIFTNVWSAVVDPKHLSDDAFVRSNADSILIPPNSFALGRSLEYFKIPRDVITICLGKSTYARCGIIVNVTPFEPEWEGYVTLEFSNTTPLPARVYANEGVAQVLFIGADWEFSEDDLPVSETRLASHPMFGQTVARRDMCEISYADRGGKYQGQRGVTLPTV